MPRKKSTDWCAVVDDGGYERAWRCSRSKSSAKRVCSEWKGRCRVKRRSALERYKEFGSR